MCLMCAGMKLDDKETIAFYKIKYGSTVTQAKMDLSDIPGMIISY